MLTDTQPRATAQSVAGVDHVYCCDPDVALCGADISDLPHGREFPDTGHAPPCRHRPSPGGGVRAGRPPEAHAPTGT